MTISHVSKNQTTVLAKGDSHSHETFTVTEPSFRCVTAAKGRMVLNRQVWNRSKQEGTAPAPLMRVGMSNSRTRCEAVFFTERRKNTYKTEETCSPQVPSTPDINAFYFDCNLIVPDMKVQMQVHQKYAGFCLTKVLLTLL